MAGFLVLRHRNHDYTTWEPVKSTHEVTSFIAIPEQHYSCDLLRVKTVLPHSNADGTK